ncbi:hypothetical protein H8356DRAFT_1657193 [Neocallimastix lanati (nom. inval.)]|jgi:hypothetical protein|nr:hypothetical protein H8356DRAFT_1657193 [Neocallimastix sp. JGI-2020a]
MKKPNDTTTTTTTNNTTNISKNTSKNTINNDKNVNTENTNNTNRSVGDAAINSKNDTNNQNTNLTSVSNANNIGNTNSSSNSNNNSSNNNSIDGVNVPIEKGNGLGVSESNISSSDKIGKDSGSFISVLIIILTVLSLFVVGAAYYVHKKKLYDKEANSSKDEFSFGVMNPYSSSKNSSKNSFSNDEYALDIMNTYQNVTPGYTDSLKQDKDNIPLENYQQIIGTTNTTNLSPINGSFNFSGFDDSIPLISQSSMITVPEQAAISRINNNYYSPNPKYY